MGAGRSLGVRDTALPRPGGSAILIATGPLALHTHIETGRPAKPVSGNFLELIMLPLAPCSKSVTSSPLLGRIFYF